MEKLLISACLAGEHTRYDGKSNLYETLLEALSPYFDLVLFCPEVVGGLKTPRKRSEIKYGGVYMEDGSNVTAEFEKGANEALRLCQFFGIKIAILKENSPSCGVSKIYDGSFSNKKKDGMGVTASLLSRNGITVYSEETAFALIEEMKKRDQIYAERDRIRKARLEATPQEETPAPVEKPIKERRPYKGKKPEHGEKRPYKGNKIEGKRRPYQKKEGGYSKKPYSKGKSHK